MADTFRSEINPDTEVTYLTAPERGFEERDKEDPAVIWCETCGKNTWHDGEAFSAWVCMHCKTERRWG